MMLKATMDHTMCDTLAHLFDVPVQMICNAHGPGAHVIRHEPNPITHVSRETNGADGAGKV